MLLKVGGSEKRKKEGVGHEGWVQNFCTQHSSRESIKVLNIFTTYSQYKRLEFLDV